MKIAFTPPFCVPFLVSPFRTFEDQSFEVTLNDLPLIIPSVKMTGFVLFPSLIYCSKPVFILGKSKMAFISPFLFRWLFLALSWKGAQPEILIASIFLSSFYSTFWAHWMSASPQHKVDQSLFSALGLKCQAKWYLQNTLNYNLCMREDRLSQFFIPRS